MHVTNRFLVKTVTTGAGQYTISDVVTGYEGVSALIDGETMELFVEAIDQYGTPTGDYEHGLYTYTASGQSLARTRIDGSSNAGAAVNWTAGTKRIGGTLLADSIRASYVGECAFAYPTNDFLKLGGKWHQVGGIPKAYDSTYHDLSRLPNWCKDYGTLVSSGLSSLTLANGQSVGSLCWDSANNRWLKLIPGATSNNLQILNADLTVINTYTISAHAYYSLGQAPNGDWVAVNGTGVTGGHAIASDPTGAWTRYTVSGPNVNSTSTSSRLMVSGSNLVALTSSSNQPYYSTDNGVNWSASTGLAGMSGVNQDMCVTADGSVLIKTTTEDVIYRSAAGGTSYSAITLPGGFRAAVGGLAADTSGNAILLVICNGTSIPRVFTTSDNGANWTHRGIAAPNIAFASTAGRMNIVWDGTYFVHAYQSLGNTACAISKYNTSGALVESYAMSKGLHDGNTNGNTGQFNLTYGNGRYLSCSLANGYYLWYPKTPSGNPNEIFFPTSAQSAGFSSRNLSGYWRTK